MPLGAVQLEDLVVLEPPSTDPLLGQVLEAHGGDGGIRGRILGDVTSGRRSGAAVPFADAPMRSLSADEVERFQAATRQT